MVRRRATPAVPDQQTASRRAASAQAGGRLSLDTSTFYFAGPLVLLPPPDAERSWRAWRLDNRTLDKLSPVQLIELLAELSPDLSRALYDFLRFCNPGYEVTVTRLADGEPEPRGQALVDAFLARLDGLYGSSDLVINRLFTALYLRGAFMLELVFDEAGREAVDLATPDPATARFRYVHDPVRGQTWQLGQWQLGAFVTLDRPTIRYVPLDPLPGSPYGRAPASAALFPILFLTGLLHDLRRVVAQQGYPRIDLTIDLQRLRDALPVETQQDPTAFADAVDALVSKIQQQYGAMAPDDAYVHTDAIQVNGPVGTAGTAQLGAVQQLIGQLEHMIVRALKTMPILQGMTDNVSEANSNRQWEVHAAGIKALQHLVETELGHKLQLLLEAQGVQAHVEFRFAELRSAELLRDQQTRQLEIANAQAEYAAGWISQEEASVRVEGHAPDQPTPRAWPLTETPVPTNPATVQPEPGSARGQTAPASPVSVLAAGPRWSVTTTTPPEVEQEWTTTNGAKR